MDTRTHSNLIKINNNNNNNNIDEQEDIMHKCPFLPPEIWRSIFLQCDYSSLKALRRVSRTLHNIINAKDFDALLFRLPNGPAASTGQDSMDHDYDPDHEHSLPLAGRQGEHVQQACLAGNIRLHPVLEDFRAIRRLSHGSLQRIELRNELLQCTPPAPQQPGADFESATWPPSTLIRVRFGFSSVDGDVYAFYEAEHPPSSRHRVTIGRLVTHVLSVFNEDRPMSWQRLVIDRLSIRPVAQAEGVLEIDVWYTDIYNGRTRDGHEAYMWYGADSDSEYDR